MAPVIDDSILSLSRERLQTLAIRDHQADSFVCVDDRIALCEGIFGSDPVSTLEEKRSTGVSNDEARIFLEFAKALLDRYERDQDNADLDCQIALLNLFSALLSDNHALYKEATYALAEGLHHRFESTRNADDLNRAIHLHETIHTSYHTEGERPSWMSSGLAIALLSRYKMTGRTADLARSTALLRDALSRCLNSQGSQQAPLVEGLGRALAFSQDLSELREARTLLKKALKLRTPAHRDYATSLCTLASVLFQLHERTGNWVEHDEGISYYESALLLYPSGSAGNILVVNNLSNGLDRRYLQTGESSNIERARMLLEDLLGNINRDHPSRPMLLNTYASVLNSLYEVTQAVDHVEASLIAWRECVELVPIGHPRRAAVVHNLGYCLLMRFLALGEAADAASAIETMQQTIDLTPQEHELHAHFTGNLAFTYFMRYERLGRQDDLLESIRLFQEALPKINNHEAQEGLSHYRNGANAFFALYHQSADVKQLERSIEYYEKSLQLGRLSTHFFRSQFLQSLVHARLARFNHLHIEEDVHLAMSLQNEALQLAPSGHPLHVDVACGLAALHLSQHSPYYNVNTALDALLEALNEPCCTAQSKLQQCLRVFNKMMATVDTYQLSDEAIEKLQLTYQRLMGLLPQIAFLGLSPRSRLQILKETETFVRGAASYALMLGRSTAALEFLEQGRAVFWSQYLRTRFTFGTELAKDQLPEELISVAQQLQRADNRDSTSDRSGAQSEASNDALASSQRKLGVKFEKLVQQVRSQPGCDRFLLPDTFSILVRAADHHPVVVLLPGESMSYALLLRAGVDKPKSITLPHVTSERLEHLNQELRTSSNLDRGRLVGELEYNSRAQRAVRVKSSEVSSPVLRELWIGIVHPIFQALAWKSTANDTDQPRLHICSTGPFAHLPVHAACLLSKDVSRTFSQYAVPSYTPTLGVLLAARRNLPKVRKADVSILLAAVQKGFHLRWPPLHCAMEEARIIQEIVNPHNLLPLTSGDAKTLAIDPTAQDVLHVLPSTNVLHLACHGYQSPVDPLASGFVMSDRMLTVENLMALQLPQSLFAFLSACETAKGDDQQPDQAVHLAATLLFAGFKSVIGTMWSMNDVDGPVVAKIVYEMLFGSEGEFLDLEVIPRALDKAMRTLRDRGVRPSRWATYVHIGI